MDAKRFLEIVHFAERLKDVTRHAYTSGGRHESVAEHSWRLCLMAFFLRDEFPDADMDKVARDIIDNAGYKGAFGHSLGHGVGLKIHELPNLSWAVGERTLRAGEIVTVEPGIYLEGEFGVRIEDMVYISENGAVNLTNAPKNLIEVC